MCPILDVKYTEAAKRLISARYDLDDLDNDLYVRRLKTRSSRYRV